MGPNATKAMAETSPDRLQKPGFLTTPGEVRNKIYRMLLTTTCAFQEYGYETEDNSRYELQPAILGVNHQTYHEARTILYEDNLWIVLIINRENWPRRYDDGGIYLPVVSRTATSRLQSPALIITLDLPEGRQQKYTTTLIMGRESLPGAFICRQPFYLPLPTINVVCNS